VTRLGQLEATVMSCLWSTERPMSVREVLSLVNADRDLAYSTVMTVLDNLHRKNMVLRKKSGRAWLYVPAASRSVYTAELMEQALDFSPDRGSALLRFVEQLPEAEVAQLRRVLDSTVETDGR
jgi:predicted transcriptional regulator